VPLLRALLALYEMKNETQTGDDSRKCQTATATPSKPGGTPV